VTVVPTSLHSPSAGDTYTVSTHPIPIQWSVITYPDPVDDGDDEDDWTADD